MKLIELKDYLIFVDESAALKRGDYYFTESKSMKAEFSLFKANTDRLATVATELKAAKVLSYHPLSKDAAEIDLPLLPNPFKGVIFGIEDIRNAFIEGTHWKEKYNDNSNEYLLARPDLHKSIRTLNIPAMPTDFIPFEDLRKITMSTGKPLLCGRYSYNTGPL